MNRDPPEPTDKSCNVCDTGHVEVGSAWSRCSNRNCPTRQRDCPLSTDSDPDEIAEWWKIQAAEEQEDGPSQEEVDEAVREAYSDFKSAPGHDTATQKNGAVKALLPLSSYDGWGELQMEMEG